MTSSLAKVNKSSGAHFRALFLKYPNFLMFLDIQINLLILKIIKNWLQFLFIVTAAVLKQQILSQIFILQILQ